MTLEELKVYQMAMDIGERVWAAVAQWDRFAQDTVGKQWVRAADSIAANLSEGFGRFHFKENKQFGYYGRGSLFETKTWLAKAGNRRLITPEASAALAADLNQLCRLLNAYIRSIGTTSHAVRETPAEYGHEVICHLSLGKDDPFANPDLPMNTDEGPTSEEVIGH